MSQRQRTLGHYILEEELGRGLFGPVFAAVDTKLNRRVALKVIVVPEHGAKALRRLEIEAKLLAKIQRPEFLKIYDFGTIDSQAYIATELITESNIAAIIKVERISLAQALRWTILLLNSLQVIHAEGYAHRNLKPENLFLVQGTLKIGDFGLARPESNEESLTMSLESKEHSYYTAPEVLLHEKVDQRADIYSLGALAFEWMTGHPPFAGDRKDQVEANILQNTLNITVEFRRLKPSFQAMLRKCLALDPSQRFQNCEELLSTLHELEEKLITEQVAAKHSKVINFSAGLSIIVALVICANLLFQYFNIESLEINAQKQIHKLEEQSNALLPVEKSKSLPYLTQRFKVLNIEMNRSGLTQKDIRTEFSTILELFLQTHSPLTQPQKAKEESQQSQSEDLYYHASRLIWRARFSPQFVRANTQTRLEANAKQWLEDIPERHSSYADLLRAESLLYLVSRKVIAPGPSVIQRFKKLQTINPPVSQMQVLELEFSLLLYDLAESPTIDEACTIAEKCLTLTRKPEFMSSATSLFHRHCHSVQRRFPMDSVQWQEFQEVIDPIRLNLKLPNQVFEAYLNEPFQTSLRKRLEMWQILESAQKDLPWLLEDNLKTITRYSYFAALEGQEIFAARAAMQRRLRNEIENQAELPQLFAIARQTMLFQIYSLSSSSQVVVNMLREELRRRNLESSSPYVIEFQIYNLYCETQKLEQKINRSTIANPKLLIDCFQETRAKVAKLAKQVNSQELNLFIEAIEFSRTSLVEPTTGDFEQRWRDKLKTSKVFKTYKVLDRESMKIHYAISIIHAVMHKLNNHVKSMPLKEFRQLLILANAAYTELQSANQRLPRILDCEVPQNSPFKKFIEAIDGQIANARNFYSARQSQSEKGK